MMGLTHNKLRIIALLIGGAFAVAGFVSASSVHAATLRGDLVVDDETIMLGDIFDNLGEAGHIPVAASPPPGQTVKIAAWSLQRLASQNGIEWANALALETVDVRRASRQLSQIEVAENVRRLLDARFLGTDVEIQLNHGNFTMHLPTIGPEPDYSLVAFDERSGRFQIQIEAVGLRPMTLTGTVTEVMDVPVLSQPIERGHVVREEDLSWIRVPINRLGAQMISDPSELVGKSAKRPLRSGQPLRLSDLRRPIAINKGALVTMTFNVPGMQLTDTGRATEQGAIGDTIAVFEPALPSHCLRTGDRSRSN